MVISAKTTRWTSFFFFTKRSATTIQAITKIISPKYCGVKMREPKKPNVGYHGTPLIQLSVKKSKNPSPFFRRTIGYMLRMPYGYHMLLEEPLTKMECNAPVKIHAGISRGQPEVKLLRNAPLIPKSGKKNP